jgi:hypothetical protein
MVCDEIKKELNAESACKNVAISYSLQSSKDYSIC